MNEPIDLTEYSHDIHEVHNNIFQGIESNSIQYLNTMGSSVGIATDYELDGPRIVSQ
jgi:hypothetical protein